MAGTVLANTWQILVGTNLASGCQIMAGMNLATGYQNMVGMNLACVLPFSGWHEFCMYVTNSYLA